MRPARAHGPSLSPPGKTARARLGQYQAGGEGRSGSRGGEGPGPRALLLPPCRAARSVALGGGGGGARPGPRCPESVPLTGGPTGRSPGVVLPPRGCQAIGARPRSSSEGTRDTPGRPGPRERSAAGALPSEPASSAPFP